MNTSSFFRHRWVQRCLWLLAILVSMGALLWQWVNSAGVKAWNRAATAFVNDGETLDFRSIVDPPVPDELNFGALPLFKDIALDSADAAGLEAAEAREGLALLILPSPADYPQGGTRPSLGDGPGSGKKADLEAWAEWLRGEGSLEMPPAAGDPAKEILAGLAIQDTMVQEIASGLGHPEARWTPAWKTRELPGMMFAVSVPHYMPLQSMAHYFAFRAIVAARAGDAAKAHESLLILVRLIQATERDPLLIGNLVATTQTAYLSRAVWEVCEARVGSVADFERLEQALAAMQLTDSLLLAFRAEAAASTSSILWLKGSHEGSKVLPPVYSSRFMPNGWFDLQAATTLTLHQTYVIQPLRDGGLAAGLKKQAELKERFEQESGAVLLNLDSVMARLSMPVYETVTVRTVYGESMVLQMRAACALEAFYHKHQRYPASLDELQDSVGRVGWLPADPFTQRPLGYKSTPDQRYRLWTFGLDQTDNGGRRGAPGAKLTDPDYLGDWVWDYTAVEAEGR
jgi:hypothetical protein